MLQLPANSFHSYNLPILESYHDILTPIQLTDNSRKNINHPKSHRQLRLCGSSRSCTKPQSIFRALTPRTILITWTLNIIRHPPSIRIRNIRTSGGFIRDIDSTMIHNMSSNMRVDFPVDTFARDIANIGAVFRLVGLFRHDSFPDDADEGRCHAVGDGPVCCAIAVEGYCAARSVDGDGGCLALAGLALVPDFVEDVPGIVITFDGN